MLTLIKRLFSFWVMELDIRERMECLFSRKRLSRPSFPQVSRDVFPMIYDLVQVERAVFVHLFARHVGNLFERDSGLLDSLKGLTRTQGLDYGVRLVQFGAVVDGIYGPGPFDDMGVGVSRGMHLFYSHPDTLVDCVRDMTAYSKQREIVFWRDHRP